MLPAGAEFKPALDAIKGKMKALTITYTGNDSLILLIPFTSNINKLYSLDLNLNSKYADIISLVFKEYKEKGSCFCR